MSWTNIALLPINCQPKSSQSSDSFAFLWAERSKGVGPPVHFGWDFLLFPFFENCLHLSLRQVRCMQRRLTEYIYSFTEYTEYTEVRAKKADRNLRHFQFSDLPIRLRCSCSSSENLFDIFLPKFFFFLHFTSSMMIHFLPKFFLLAPSKVDHITHIATSVLCLIHFCQLPFFYLNFPWYEVNHISCKSSMLVAKKIIDIIHTRSTTWAT